MKRLNYCFLVILAIILSSCSITDAYDASVNWKYRRNDVLKKVIYNEGDTITYYSGGTGDTLILIHGFGSGGQKTWSNNIKTLAKKHYLIIPDLLAFGSTRSANSGYDLERQTEIIKKICSREKVTKTSVAGISYGGFVALIFANQNTKLLNKLVLIDSPGHIYDSQNSFELAEAYGENHPSDIFIPKNYEEVHRLINLGIYKDKKIPKFLLKRMYEAYFSGKEEAQLKVMNALIEAEEPTINPLLLDGRTTVIWGKHDEIFDLKYGQELASVMNAEIYIISEAGHVPNGEKPKTFNTILLNLLK